MPCRSAAPDVGDAVAHRGQALDDRRAGPARARVRGDADRLVDDHEVVVVVQHDEPVDRLRRRSATAAARAASPRAASRRAPCALRGRLAARRRSRCPASIRSAAAVRENPSSREIATSRRSPSSPSGTGSSRVSASGPVPAPAGPSSVDAEQRSARRRGSAPHTIAESARLKIGQCSAVRPEQADPVDDVTAERRPARGRSGRPGCPARRRGSARARPPSRSSASGWPSAR